MEPLSPKNTKAEILEAYESLLKNVQTAKADVPKQQQDEKQKNEAVAKVADLTNDGIMTSIANLKSLFDKSLEELQQDITTEFRKLQEIRAAIAIEKQSLEDLYALSANTDSLAAMLLAQKEKKETFDKMMSDTREAFEVEMNEKRAAWDAEKTKQKALDKENEDDRTKRRTREEEEYAYNIKISRQKDQNDYDSKQATLDKELKEKKILFEQEIANREAALNAAEAELAELRKNSAAFPAQLEKALKDKEAEIGKALKIQYDFDIQLRTKQSEADNRLKDQMISSLQEKIKEMQIQVKEYADKATRAEAGVKDIAVKAIENAANVRVIGDKKGEEN